MESSSQFTWNNQHCEPPYVYNHPHRLLRLLGLSEFLDLTNLHLPHLSRWGGRFLGVNELDLLSKQIPSFVAKLTFFEACKFLILASVCWASSHMTQMTRIISLNNDSHAAKIHNFLSIDFLDIAITVLLLLFTVFPPSDLFMLCKRFNKRPFSKCKAGRLLEDGRLFEGAYVIASILK